MMVRLVTIDGDKSRMKERTTTITLLNAQGRDDLMRDGPKILVGVTPIITSFLS